MVLALVQELERFADMASSFPTNSDGLSLEYTVLEQPQLTNRSASIHIASLRIPLLPPTYAVVGPLPVLEQQDLRVFC